MKKLSILFTLSVVILVSCTDDSEDVTSSGATSLDLTTEASIESSYEDVDVISEAGMAELSNSGRVMRDPLLECATVEKDTANNVITIDYGEGCEGPNGHVRSGKIIIEYSERRFVPGAFRTVTLENFHVDSIAVEGTRTITNTAESLDENPQFEVVLSGGRLTFPDGTFATREATHIRTWFRANNPLQDSASLTGEARGVLRDGTTYSIVIIEDLVFERTCRTNGVVVPVAGVKQITYGDDQVITIDYGDGTCDNLAEVTQDGETQIVNISPRGRRFRRG